MLIFFLLSMLSYQCSATTFAMQSIEQQIKEADGVVMGHFLESRSVELNSGEVATQMIFKVFKEWGMQSELFGMDEIIVHYPGGKIGNLNVQVQGVPQFIIGEKVVLFIKNLDNRYWGHNLGFGTFKIINYGKDSMLVNSLFPSHPKVGQMRLGKFEANIKMIKGSSLKEIRTDHIDMEEGREPASAEVKQGKNRSVASTQDPAENRQKQPTLSVFWLVVILALAGGITRLVRTRDL